MMGWGAPFGPLWDATGVALLGLAIAFLIRAHQAAATRAGRQYAVTWRVLAVLLVLGALIRLLALWL